MQAAVDGILSPLSELSKITDWPSIRKVGSCLFSPYRLCFTQRSCDQYNKLNGEPALQVAGTDVQRQQSIIDEIVTSSVAMKSVMA